MNTIKELYEDIIRLSDILDDHGICSIKIPDGCDGIVIEKYESDNNMQFPPKYKEFIGLMNGIRYNMSCILPLDKVELLSIPDEVKGYYMLGSYIGNGSLIVCNPKGDFFCYDHDYGTLKEMDFAEFLKEDIIYYLKDAFKEYSIELPEDLYTAPTVADIINDLEASKQNLLTIKKIYLGRLDGTENDKKLLAQIEEIDELIRKKDDEIKSYR